MNCWRRISPACRRSIAPLVRPQHPVPAFAGPVFRAAYRRARPLSGQQGYRRVSSIRGRMAVTPLHAGASARSRIGNPRAERHARGSFLAAVCAARMRRRVRDARRYSCPDPCYAAYSAGATAAHCDTVFLPTTAKSGFLPDIASLDDALLARTIAFYLAVTGQSARRGRKQRLPSQAACARAQA